MPPEPTVDHRYILANERTCLAYVRTALSLQVAGLAAMQFLPRAEDIVRAVLGVGLVAAGSFAGAAGWMRWRANERAIRAGDDIPAARALAPVVIAVVLLPAVAALALVLR